MLVSNESLVDAVQRDAELLRLGNELRRAREALLDAQAQRASFELEVLNSRDHAVGQAAHIGELRYRLLKQAAGYLIHDKNHRDHIARLEAALAESSRTAAQTEALRRELTATRNSTTWKLGRVLMFPVRAVKRLLRRG